ncbi:hypothetical protein [Cyanobium sp. Morenito 9A2]|uniref:hypothetical protein n=1 Tax=Cyanobium sp. Morenito 9A2 TaxID=2823718 RepID=UPI0020CBB9FA|nr:hypothetical protein [Cyanobium sp. Morenito 9A2]MCP9848479.1 hypothetical protein [Cyanobium sp. Morenito 9A2]
MDSGALARGSTDRRDRASCGQRGPLNRDDLERISAAFAGASVVRRLGHGAGESDLRQQLLRHLKAHPRPDGRIVGEVSLNDGGHGEAEPLAIAREEFGNLPHRRPLRMPGQGLREG